MAGPVKLAASKSRLVVPNCLIVCAVLAGCKRSSSSAAVPVISRAPETSQPLPPTKSRAMETGWTLESREHVRLADLRNKVVVLDFYATWCAPCRESTPHLVELQKRYGPQGLTVVGLNVGGPDDRDQVAEFAREFHVQYQLGFPDAEVEDFYLGDNDAIPQTFILDRNGEVVKRFVGYDDFVAESLERVIQASLAGTGSTQPAK